MTSLSYKQARTLLAEHGQEHVLRLWDSLDESCRERLLAEVETVDFSLINRLIDEWIVHKPVAEAFSDIRPIPNIPPVDLSSSEAREALAAGEQALRAGEVGLLVVAGGQGTRLGFDGPKGAYPIGPISHRSLFSFHAEKIHNFQRRFGRTLPWYVMVSRATDSQTRRFFRDNNFFGLGEKNVVFFQQEMMPCIDDQGKLMLETPHSLAMNPSGHGGCIPAMVKRGIIQDARERGIDMLSYFQVDNWAIKLIDPVFIGYHALRNAQMSSKVHRKRDLREAVGVHCLCDGEYRVIEYTELDIYPQLLETDAGGGMIYFAGNTAIHLLSLDFVEQMHNAYSQFPWHCSHKKIPCLDQGGNIVQPDHPNGYKFETFVFDALRFTTHEPVALLIDSTGEYTPIKTYEGDNSVVAARQSMREYWGEWLEVAGWPVPRDEMGKVSIAIEISPQFAFTKEEFLEKIAQVPRPQGGDIGIGPNGELL